jgi:hypothetical protein
VSDDRRKGCIFAAYLAFNLTGFVLARNDWRLVLATLGASIFVSLSIAALVPWKDSQ